MNYFLLTIILFATSWEGHQRILKSIERSGKADGLGKSGHGLKDGVSVLDFSLSPGFSLFQQMCETFFHWPTFFYRPRPGSIWVSNTF